METKLIPMELPIHLGDCLQEIMDTSGLGLDAFEINEHGIVVHLEGRDLNWFTQDSDGPINLEAVDLGPTVRLYRLTENSNCGYGDAEWDGNMTDDYDTALEQFAMYADADSEESE